jgi:hypothetical protein
MSQPVIIPICRWCNRHRVLLKGFWLCLVCDGPDVQKGEKIPQPPCWQSRLNP